jgi:hypothetical protein
LSPPSGVYCENAFGTSVMLMVQGGKSHDRGCERVHVVCKTSNWCNGIARPPDGVGASDRAKHTTSQVALWHLLIALQLGKLWPV